MYSIEYRRHPTQRVTVELISVLEIFMTTLVIACPELVYHVLKGLTEDALKRNACPQKL